MLWYRCESDGRCSGRGGRQAFRCVYHRFVAVYVVEGWGDRGFGRAAAFCAWSRRGAEGVCDSWGGGSLCGGDDLDFGYTLVCTAELGCRLFAATCCCGFQWRFAGAVGFYRVGRGVYSTALSPIIFGGPAACVFRPRSRGVYTTVSLLTSVVDAPSFFGAVTPAWSKAFPPAASS
jgi:hypothetical protein